MQLFYTIRIEEGIATLGESEAHHCTQVLRHKLGDQVQLIDGKGGFYKAEIIEAGRKSCTLRILEQQQSYKKRTFRVHLAVAPPKNNARFEWLLEKLTEIGIDEISPLVCQRSERRRIREGRLAKILLAATKQSGRAYLPKLNDLQSFNDFILRGDDAQAGKKFIAHCASDQLPLLLKKYQSGTDVQLMIGPEGDFSKQEIASAEAAGFVAVSLGVHRLRTETAGLIACQSIHLLNSIAQL